MAAVMGNYWLWLMVWVIPGYGWCYW